MAPDHEFVPTRIIVHHSLTKDSETVSWNAIRDYHIKIRGWADIGHHAGAKVLKIWMDLFDIELSKIFTHNYFNAARSCPGTEFDMVRLKNAILGLL